MFFFIHDAKNNRTTYTTYVSLPGPPFLLLASSAPWDDDRKFEKVGGARGVACTCIPCLGRGDASPELVRRLQQ